MRHFTLKNVAVRHRSQNRTAASARLAIHRLKESHLTESGPKPMPFFRRRYSHNSNAISDPPGRTSSISAYGASAFNRPMTAAVEPLQLHTAPASRQSEPFKINVVFAEVIFLHLGDLYSYDE